MAGLFNIGVTAINSAQINLSTTGHNISNVNTPGYSRQRAIQSPNISVATGAGYIGQGSHISTIDRLFSAFTETQVNTAQSSVSQLEIYGKQMGEINNMLADTSAGLSPAIQDFFKAIQQTATDPSSLATRQSMVSAAQALVARFQALDERLTQQYQSVNSQVGSYVASINSYSEQIAELNQRIIVAESANQQPPNDLYDMRDNSVAELNKLVKVTVTNNSDGTYNVFMGNGQQLVTGTYSGTLVAMASSADTSRMTVGLKSSGGVQELPEQIIVGGALGGALNFRSEFLDRATNDLGRMAASVALTMNAQNALGQDLQGNIFGDAGFVNDLFTLSAPRVVPSTFNAPTDPDVTISLDAASYNGNFYTNLTNSDYRLDKVGGNLRLTRLSDNISWTGANVAALQTAIDGSAQGNQGFSISASANTMGANASYILQPTREAAKNLAFNPTMAADPRQIALAAPVRMQVGANNTGGATISPGMVVTGYTATMGSLPATLTYNGGNLSGFPAFPVTVTNAAGSTTYAADPVPYVNGATISSGGISFKIEGSAKDGDTFTISKNINGISDNRNALLMNQLQTQSTMSGQKASYQTVYAQLVSDAGNKGKEIQVTLSAQTALLEQSQEARNSLSGVNLDEEAANLMRFQQAYQAAAKMLDIGSRLFDSILAIG